MDTDVKKQRSDQIAIGVAGVLFGALGAGAILLSDEATRKRAMKIAYDVKNSLKKWGATTTTNVEDRKEKIEDIKKGFEKELKN